MRLKKLEDLDLGTIGKLISMVSVDDYILRYEATRNR